MILYTTTKVVVFFFFLLLLLFILFLSFCVDGKLMYEMGVGGLIDIYIIKRRGKLTEAETKMKYVLVTGGVVSGLGKGVTASSIGVLLKACGLRVTSIKIGLCLSPSFLLLLLILGKKNISFLAVKVLPFCFLKTFLALMDLDPSFHFNFLLKYVCVLLVKEVAFATDKKKATHTLFLFYFLLVFNLRKLDFCSPTC